MDVLRIALIVLAVAGIWAVIELTLTIRKGRDAVKELTEELGDISRMANATIEQLQPVIVKIDAMADDIGPAVAQLGPLVEKASTAIDVVTVDLASVNDILVDVSSVTDTASNVTSTVSKAANSAVSGVAGVVGKFTGSGKTSRHHRLTSRSRAKEEAHAIEEPASEIVVPAEPAPAEPAPSGKTYFTYGAPTGQKGE